MRQVCNLDSDKNIPLRVFFNTKAKAQWVFCLHGFKSFLLAVRPARWYKGLLLLVLFDYIFIIEP